MSTAKTESNLDQSCFSKLDQLDFSKAVRNSAWDQVLVGMLRGADPEDKRPSGHGYSALHAAITEGRFDIVDALLRLGADPNFRAPDGGGNSLAPLHVAVMAKRPKDIALLTSKGASINTQDVNGYTPLMLAVECGNASLVTQLLMSGADPNIARHSGLTPLHVSVDNNHIDITKALLTHGANPNIENAQGVTAMNLAKVKHNLALKVLFDSCTSRQR